MNLVIDVGNTRIKLGICAQDNVQGTYVTSHEDLLSVIIKLRETYPDIKKCIISSVGRLDTVLVEKVKTFFSVMEVSAITPVPFSNLYATPETLGIDRIVLVSAAATKFPKKNVLVIDAGTCITYDFLSEENKYFGGAISPGIRMRYQAMHEFTAGLPLLETKLPENFIGDSTANCMHQGAVQGVLIEIDGFIAHYKENYENLTVILTGGDTHFLRDSLKNDIFAHSNFLLEGLHYILQYNNN